MSQESSNPWQITAFLLIGLIVGYAVHDFTNSSLEAFGSSPSQIREENTAVLPDSSEKPTIVDVSIDDDPALGNPDAPVTIVEFSDFQCPYCRRSYNELLPQLKANYIDKNLVYFVYRDNPLGFHDGAQKAAEAAECADDQNKFWKMHDAIFEGQNKLGEGTVAIPEESLQQYAVDLGLNISIFNECLDSGKYAEEVKNDLADATQYGVTGTPTFFINGYKVVGAQPYETISSIIDRFL